MGRIFWLRVQQNIGLSYGCRDALIARARIRSFSTDSGGSESHPLPAKSFEPSQVEAGRYEWWAERGYFSPKGDGKVFSMVLPPPNVTGALHLGHALTVTVQDALARWRRMCGDRVLWVPGLDHAGIATQSVVEKQLARGENPVTRHDLGREEFLKEVWKWYENYGDRINDQLRGLGASLDWSQEVFTLDECRSAAVVEAFCRLYEHGLLYRQKRMVNWCCALRTAISDIEVDHIDLSSRTKLAVPGHDPARKYEFGVLTKFAYRVSSESTDTSTGLADELVVATTRLETMLGDVAVAVHPDDPRYAHLHGKMLVHPFRDHDSPHRLIPVICDAELVDPDMGTGAVKITPAHDQNDFACGLRHGLPSFSVIDDDGRITGATCDAEMLVEGTMRYDAREILEKKLDEEGLLRGKEDHEMRLAVCSRSGDVIEPMLRPQWYVSCAGMGADADAMVRDSDVEVLPVDQRDEWHRWLGSIQDWCVSRQLWWGHRIPAYRVRCAEIDGRSGHGSYEKMEEEIWVVATSRQLAEEKARRKISAMFSISIDECPPFDLEQDEDVLDTWFSSALFPLSALGWPGTTVDERTEADTPAWSSEFYPLSVMETGSDILFFWVARMAMMCSFLDPADSATPPFRRVFLHPVVRDRQGRKMSKSLGNVIDPLDVINGATLESMLSQMASGNLPAAEISLADKTMRKEFPEGIPECGVDALRFALASYMEQGRQINMDVQRVVSARLFGNKLWNASRFVLSHPLPDTYDHTTSLRVLQSLPERWILSRLAATVAVVDDAMQQFDFAAVSNAIRIFFVNEFCDIYIELAKEPLGHPGTSASATTTEVLGFCLDSVLKLLHPIMPYVTEEIWQALRSQRLSRDSLSQDHQQAGINLSFAASNGLAESIMVAPFPGTIVNDSGVDVSKLRDPDADERMESMMRVVRSVRSIRRLAQDALGGEVVRTLDIVLEVENEKAKFALEENVGFVHQLCRHQRIAVTCPEDSTKERPAHGSPSLSRTLPRENITVRISLPSDAETATKLDSQLSRLEKRYKKICKQMEKLSGFMSRKQFQETAPVEVREKNEQRLADLAVERSDVQAILETLRMAVDHLTTKG